MVGALANSAKSSKNGISYFIPDCSIWPTHNHYISQRLLDIQYKVLSRRDQKAGDYRSYKRTYIARPYYMPLGQRPNQKEQSRVFLQSLGHVKSLPTSHIAEGLSGETPDCPCWPLLWPRLSYFFEIYTPLSGNFEAQEQGCLNQGTTILQICIEHLHDVLGSSYHIKKDLLLFVNGPAESQDIATHFPEHRLMSS